MPRTTDVLVIGGGIVGLCIAREAAVAGLSARLIERGEPGCGASDAAAGMLMPHVECENASPLLSLALAGHRIYPEFVERVSGESGIDPHLLGDGGLLLARDRDETAALERRASFYRDAGLRVEILTHGDLRRHEPGLSGDIEGGLLLPDEASVDNVLLVRGLHRAALRAGARVETGVVVTRLSLEGGRVNGVMTGAGRRDAGVVVVAAGAWSGGIGAETLPSPPTHPVRGQMVSLRPSGTPFRRILAAGSLYLVRRHDGRILIGSTMERAGFDARTTASAVDSLIARAVALVPALGEASFEGAWAGLRPATEDGLPAIGPGAAPGLLYATGHLRHGILLAPITARLIVQSLRGEDPDCDLAPFHPRRLLPAAGGR